MSFYPCRKVNGLRICFRTAKPPASGDTVRPNLEEYSPSPVSTSKGSAPLSPPAKESGYSPSPPFKHKSLPQRDENVVRMKYVAPVASAPPPITPPPASTREPTPPPKTTTQFPVTFDDDSSVTVPDAGMSAPANPPPQVTTPTPYPPPAATTNMAAPTPYPPQAATTNVVAPTPYPPPPGGGAIGGYPAPSPNQGQALPYQTNPSAPNYSQGFYGGPAAYNSAGFQPTGQPAYPSAPPVTTGYDTNIGFSFGGGGVGSGQQSTLPAPYNPYHHQQPNSPSAPNYGAPPPPRPGQQQHNTSYGFNI